MRVNLAASATGAVDRAPAFDVKGHDLSFCAAPKDADGTYVKRDPNILWQSVVAFAPPGTGRCRTVPKFTGHHLRVTGKSRRTGS